MIRLVVAGIRPTDNAGPMGKLHCMLIAVQYRPPFNDFHRVLRSSIKVGPLISRY